MCVAEVTPERMWLWLHSPKGHNNHNVQPRTRSNQSIMAASARFSTNHIVDGRYLQEGRKMYYVCMVLLMSTHLNCINPGERGDRVEDFINELPGLLTQLDVESSVMGIDRAEYLFLVGSEYQRTIGLIRRRLQEHIETATYAGANQILVGQQTYPLTEVMELHHSLSVFFNVIGERILALRTFCEESRNDNEFHTSNSCFVPVERRGQRGRPRILISRELLESFDEYGFTLTQSARMLGVTTQTLRNRRREYDMPLGQSHYSNMSSNELDERVADFLRVTPNIGERLVIGALRSQGVFVQRWRVRESILRVDPIGRACRRRRVIFRRQYSVPRHNALWYVLFVYLYIHNIGKTILLFRLWCTVLQRFQSGLSPGWKLYCNSVG